MIGASQFPLKRVLRTIGESGFRVKRTYRVFEFYGHRFIWSAGLMARVLAALGYSSARVYEVGEGSNADYCLERRRRGIYLGGDPGEDRAPGWIYDAESLAIEAVK